MNSVDKKCNHEVLIKNKEISSNSGVIYSLGDCFFCNSSGLVITHRYQKRKEINEIYGTKEDIYIKRRKKAV